MTVETALIYEVALREGDFNAAGEDAEDDIAVEEPGC